MQDLICDLDYEYESFMRLAGVYFNKWIETGEENYKEKELLYTGGAHATLRIKQIIISNQGVK